MSASILDLDCHGEVTVTSNGGSATITATGRSIRVRLGSLAQGRELLPGRRRASRRAVFHALSALVERTRTTLSIEVAGRTVATMRPRRSGDLLARALGLGALRVRWLPLAGRWLSEAVRG